MVDKIFLNAYSEEETCQGIPFYYEKQKNGTFSKIFATERHDYSQQALDYLNYMQFDERFRKNDSEFYPLQSIVNGEKRIVIGEKSYRVDGYVKTEKDLYCLEFNGCRQGLKILKLI